MSATHTTDSTATAAPVLYLAFELGWNSWKLAFTIGAGQKPRLRTIPARNLETLLLEIHHARRRFGLAEATPVISCYEAGRDGFWLHRYLAHQGIEHLRGRCRFHRGQSPPTPRQIGQPRRGQARRHAHPMASR